MPPRKTKIVDTASIIPTKPDSKEQIKLVERMVESSIGDLLLDSKLAVVMLSGGGIWIECEMTLREKLFCQALAASMDVKVSAKAVRLEIAQAEKILAKTDPRQYLSILLEEQLDDRARSPEEIRSKMIKVHDAVMREKITHHQAAQALKALELYAKVSGMMVQEQAIEKKTQSLGFSAG